MGKYLLSQRYGVPVTSELVLRDEDGWYPQIRLQYHLLADIISVQQRDRQELTDHLEWGNNKLALYDVKLLGAQVQALRSLGIPELLSPYREFRASDTWIQHLAELVVRYRDDLKTVLNLNFNAEMSSIQIVQTLLQKLGLKLRCIKHERIAGGGRQRVYQFVPPDDGREEVFSEWKARDLMTQT